jgi:chaperonin GroEL
VALLRAQAGLAKMEAHGDERAGIDIVAHALEAPMRMIAYNAGAEGSVVVERVKAMKGAMGYNAATGEFEDLVAAGIVDPTKVARSALQNAASIAALLLTTEAIVTDIPEEERPAPGGMGGMGGME